MMDQLLVRGLKVFAYHGVYPEEKKNGQEFILDITMDLDLTKAGESDCLEDSYSYGNAARTAARVMTAQSDNLLERAATRVIEALFLDCPQAQRIEVVLKKPHAPVKLEFDYMAVRLVRERRNTCV